MLEIDNLQRLYEAKNAIQAHTATDEQTQIFNELATQDALGSALIHLDRLTQERDDAQHMLAGARDQIERINATLKRERVDYSRCKDVLSKVKDLNRRGETYTSERTRDLIELAGF